MRLAAILFCLVTVSSAAPFGFFNRNKATGHAQAGVASGTQTFPHGSSQISQHSSSAGGTSQGNAISINSANTQQSGSTGLFPHQSIETNAQSIQLSGNRYGNPHFRHYG